MSNLTRHAFVKNGIVINVVDYDATKTGIPPGFDDPALAVVATDIGEIGWLYENSVFTDPHPVPAPTAAAVAAMARQTLDEQERLQAKADAAILALVNATPPQLVTYARTNFPSLTLAEQNKMGIILNILAIAVRDRMR